MNFMNQNDLSLLGQSMNNLAGSIQSSANRRGQMAYQQALQEAIGGGMNPDTIGSLIQQHGGNMSPDAMMALANMANGMKEKARQEKLNQLMIQAGSDILALKGTKPTPEQIMGLESFQEFHAHGGDPNMLFSFVGDYGKMMKEEEQKAETVELYRDGKGYDIPKELEAEAIKQGMTRLPQEKAEKVDVETITMYDKNGRAWKGEKGSQRHQELLADKGAEWSDIKPETRRASEKMKLLFIKHGVKDSDNISPEKASAILKDLNRGDMTALFGAMLSGQLTGVEDNGADEGEQEEGGQEGVQTNKAEYKIGDTRIGPDGKTYKKVAEGEWEPQ